MPSNIASDDLMIIDSPARVPGQYPIGQADPDPAEHTTHATSNPDADMSIGDSDLRSMSDSTRINGVERMSRKVAAMLPFGVGGGRRASGAGQPGGAIRSEQHQTFTFGGALTRNDNKLHGLREQVANLRRVMVNRNNRIQDLEMELELSKQDHSNYRKAAEIEVRQLREYCSLAEQRQQRAVHHDQEQDGRVRDQLAKANKEIGRLQNALEECKDRIFDMQPDQHVSDAQISDLYSSLCESIGDWVDSNFECMGGLLKDIRPTRIGPQVASAFQKYFPEGALDLVHRFPVAESILIETLLHGFFSEKILTTADHFPGLHPQHEDFLGRVEEGFVKLSARMGDTSKAFWTPKCYEAMLEDPGFKQGRDLHINKLWKAIETIFKKLAPKPQWQQIDFGKLLSIVRQAADLVSRIDTLPTMYSFKYLFDLDNIAETSPLDVSDWDKYTIFDIESGRTVRSTANVRVGDHGRVGLKLCAISPALIRDGSSGQQNLTLVKESVLVKLDKPLIRNNKRKIGEIEKSTEC